MNFLGFGTKTHAKLRMANRLEHWPVRSSWQSNQIALHRSKGCSSNLGDAMMVKNYYHVLGVNQDVGADEIKNAYRKLAHQYHPDVSHDPNGEDKFKEIGEAYETLKIPERRQAYDRQAFRYLGRRAGDVSIIDFYTCWSEILWINYWSWWVDPDLWQSETQHASTTV